MQKRLKLVGFCVVCTVPRQQYLVVQRFSDGTTAVETLRAKGVTEAAEQMGRRAGVQRYRIVDWLERECFITTTDVNEVAIWPHPYKELTDNDYVVQSNVWLSVGQVSLRVAKLPNGCCRIQAYPRGDEMNTAIGSLLVKPKKEERGNKS